MKSIKALAISGLLVPCVLMAELVKIDFSVTDYDGNPLPDVQVEFGTDGKLIAPYLKTPKRHLACKTGKDGTASDRFLCWDGFVHCYFRKDGFYPVSVRDVMYGADYDARTDKMTFATNHQSVVVKMKRMRNPAEMVHHRCFKGKIQYPGTAGAWGFDLLSFDWVSPWGKGKVADFVVHYESNEDENNRTVTGSIAFVEPASGGYIKKERGRV